MCRRRNCGAPLRGGRCLGHKTVPKQECGGGRSGAGASSCAGLRGAVVGCESDGPQERQRHSGSVISLGSVSVPGAAGGLGFCVPDSSSEIGVAGEERPSARAAMKLRRQRGGVSAAVRVLQRERSAGRR